MRASVYIKILFDFLCLIFSGFMYGRLIVSSLTDGQFRFFEIGDSVSSVEEEKDPGRCMEVHEGKTNPATSISVLSPCNLPF